MDKLIGDVSEMLVFGADLARSCDKVGVVFLSGKLGAGKTTLVRGFLQGLGYQQSVKSPTYALVESYELQGKRIFHFDLYRLADPEELEFIGFRDYFTGDAICLVEWPEHGGGLLPDADLSCHINIENSRRRISCQAMTDVGKKILAEIFS